MRLTALGVGDAFSARWYSSCLLLEAEQGRLLIDCPHPIRKMLAENATVDIPEIDGVILTHLHGDHVSGLEGLAWFNHFALGRRTRLYAHPAVLGPLWEGHLACAMSQLLDAKGGVHRLRFEDLFEAVPLDLRAPVRAGPFSVRCRMTRHHIPTTALRIRADGVELGYSADTSFDPSLVDWLAEADLVVHETNLGTHTPYDELLGLDPALRARMRLIHYPDSFAPETSAIPGLGQGEPVLVTPR